MTAHRTPADAGIAGDGWQAGFLHALRASGNVSAAARAAGTCRSRCYEARRRDPGFAAAWADALEEAADRLEMEAFRHAGTRHDGAFHRRDQRPPADSEAGRLSWPFSLAEDLDDAPRKGAAVELGFLASGAQSGIYRLDPKLSAGLRNFGQCCFMKN